MAKRASKPMDRNPSLSDVLKLPGIETQQDVVNEVSHERRQNRRGPKEAELSNEVIKDLSKYHGNELLEFIRQQLKRKGLLGMSFFKFSPTIQTKEERKQYSGDIGRKTFGSRERLAEVMRGVLERNGVLGAGFELTSSTRYEGDIITYLGEEPQKDKEKIGKIIIKYRM